MFGLSKLLRAGEGRTVKRLSKIADQVMALEGEYEKLTDEELKAKTDEFKQQIELSLIHISEPTRRTQ